MDPINIATESFIKFSLLQQNDEIIQFPQKNRKGKIFSEL